jgi:NAD(P)-dependent dehydrogenase (short-subunit alcohol dehydrogenase family)
MTGTAVSQDLAGRVVAVTGAARGIGQVLGQAFIERGAQLVALDRRWDEDAAWTHRLREAGGLMLAADITDDAALDDALAVTLRRFGTVDVLVNNAAMRQRDLYPVAGACAVLDTEDAHWSRMFEINVVGTLKVTRRFIRPMLAQGRGSVVMVSANGSLTQGVAPGVAEGNHPGLLNQPYDATKAALTSLGVLPGGRGAAFRAWP